jgi:Domain of unknown function (DUF6249)
MFELAYLLPVLLIALMLGAVTVWVLAWHQRRVRELDFRHQERMAAIEKGLEMPPEPLPRPTQASNARSLQRGLICIGVGLALTFGGQDWLGPHGGGAGWIVFAVGAAYLIFYFVEGRKPTVPRHEVPPAGSDHNS